MGRLHAAAPGIVRLALNCEAAPGVVVKGKDGKTQTLSADHVILATGARARTLPKAGLEPDGKLIWTYREAMVPDRVPKSLLVVGSGAIGIEFASFFNTLGAKTTVVEVMDRVLPVEDSDISALPLSSAQRAVIDATREALANGQGN